MIKLVKCGEFAPLKTNYKSVDGVLAYIAVSEEGLLGHCIYRINGGVGELLELRIGDDSFAVADGLCRAALFDCMDEGCASGRLNSDGAMLDRFMKAYRLNENESFSLADFFKPHCE